MPCDLLTPVHSKIQDLFPKRQTSSFSFLPSFLTRVTLGLDLLVGFFFPPFLLSYLLMKFIIDFLFTSTGLK